MIKTMPILKVFDPSTIHVNAFCLCVGRRNTGKTTLMSHLVRENKKISKTLVFCGTQDENEQYSKLDDTTVYEGYCPDILDTYIGEQKKSMRTGADNSVCVVLDNIEYKDIWKDRCLFTLVRNNRYLRTFVYASSSCVFFIPPVVRSCADYIFLFKETNKENLERLYRSFGNMFNTFEEFIHVFNICTETPNGCMVVDNTSNSRDIFDVFFMYNVSFANL